MEIAQDGEAKAHSPTWSQTYWKNCDSPHNSHTSKKHCRKLTQPPTRTISLYPGPSSHRFRRGHWPVAADRGRTQRARSGVKMAAGREIRSGPGSPVGGRSGGAARATAMASDTARRPTPADLLFTNFAPEADIRPRSAKQVSGDLRECVGFELVWVWSRVLRWFGVELRCAACVGGLRGRCSFGGAWGAIWKGAEMIWPYTAWVISKSRIFTFLMFSFVLLCSNLFQAFVKWEPCQEF